jgi:hypothetical protein
LFLGNITDGQASTPGQAGIPNSNFYLFDFTEVVINWDSYTADQLAPVSNTTNTPNPKNPNPSPPSSNESDQTNQTNKSVIIGLSVGLGTIIIASVVAFTLIYKRMKKNKNAANITEFDPHGQPVTPGILEIPSGSDKHHPTMNQQYSPVNQQQYSINQQQYSMNQQQYPINQQQYPINQQQYPINQQYPVNQQHPVSQQYPINQ